MIGDRYLCISSKVCKIAIKMLQNKIFNSISHSIKISRFSILLCKMDSLSYNFGSIFL